MQKRRITVLVGPRVFGIDVDKRTNYGRDMESRPTHYTASLHEFTGNGLTSYGLGVMNNFDSFEEAFGKVVESIVGFVSIPEPEGD